MTHHLDREFIQVFLAGALLSLPLAVAAATVVYKSLGGTHARTH